jgi:drug/metabolite transporter (DMT)-like permease
VVGLHLPGGTRIGLALVLAAGLSWAVANLIVKRMSGGAAARRRARANPWPS